MTSTIRDRESICGGGRRYVTFTAIVFALNLVWENAHGGLYDHTMSGWDFLRSAGGDVLLVLVGMVAALPWRRTICRYRVAVVIVLTALAVGVELFALSVDRWAYTDAMPTLGPIGLSPLLQLSTTAMVALWLTDRGRRTRTSDKAPADRPER